MGIRIHKDWAFYAPFQFFWILVILPKAVQLVCLGALMLLCAFQSGKEKPLDKFSVLQLAFLLIYGVAIVVNSLWGDHEMRRIFAAINTWAINLIALFLYHFCRHTQLDQRRLEKYSIVNLAILIGVWCVFKLLGNSLPVVMGHTVCAPDWVGYGYMLRFTGYLDYPNMVVVCILLFYPLAIPYLQRRKILAAVMTILLFLPIYDTNSRSGLVLYLVVLLAYALFVLQESFFRYYSQRKYALLALAILSVVTLAILLAGQVIEIIQNLVGMREGSNSMRMLIYQTSLQTMWEQSPVFGIGIKDMLGDYPLGSHSTYLGVFYKAGILGGLLYLVSIFGMAAKKLTHTDTDRFSVVSKLCMLAVLLLMIFEDIDGTNWFICIFYIFLTMIDRKAICPEKNNNQLEGPL